MCIQNFEKAKWICLFTFWFEGTKCYKISFRFGRAKEFYSWKKKKRARQKKTLFSSVYQHFLFCFGHVHGFELHAFIVIYFVRSRNAIANCYVMSLMFSLNVPSFFPFSSLLLFPLLPHFFPSSSLTSQQWWSFVERVVLRCRKFVHVVFSSGFSSLFIYFLIVSSAIAAHYIFRLFCSNMHLTQ